MDAHTRPAIATIPIILTFHHATKYILVTIGIIIIKAPKSGWSMTRKEGSHTIPKNGIKPSDVLDRTFLYRLQKAATAKMRESFRNSVG